MTSSSVGLVIAVAAGVTTLVALEVRLVVDRLRELGADVSSAISSQPSASSPSAPRQVARARANETVSASPMRSPAPVAAADRAGSATAGELRASGSVSDAGVASELTTTPTHSLQRCPTQLRLLASVVNAAHPRRSIAAVKVAGGTRLLNIGERIDGLTLVALRPQRAFLQPAEGPVCVMPVFLPASERLAAVAKPKTTTKPAASRAPRKPVLSAEELRAGVRRVSDDTFAVTRALLVKALASPAALRKGARVRVQTDPERARGLELVALRRNSPLGALGLAKGDVVSKLNGYDLTDPGAALQAFTLLKTQSRFSLSLARSGVPQTITYLVD